MDWSHLPPLSMLRALAAYAETGGTAAAGDKLNVSHAAVSQQLRALETHLGIALFDRSGRSLQLTSEGQALAQACLRGFDDIAATTGRLTGAENARPLQISTTPAFATNWLMPRLPRFREAHPEIGLVLDPTAEIVTLGNGAVDLCIRYGRGDWPGVDVTPLLISPMVVVAAPSLVGELRNAEPDELRDFPWIEELGTSEGQRWLSKHGIDAHTPARNVTLPGNLHLDAARSGQGLAAMVRLFAERDLEARRLVELHCEQAPNSGYYLLVRRGVMRPSLKAFTNWLKRESIRD